MTRWGEIWRSLDRGDRRRAAEDFWRLGDAEIEVLRQAEAYLAEAYRFRLQRVTAMGRDHRAVLLAQRDDLPDRLIRNSMTCFHMARRRPMLTRFLDELGIAHDDGVLWRRKHMPDSAEVEALQSAIATLRAKFPEEEVELYLDVLEAYGEVPFDRIAEAREAVPPRDPFEDSLPESERFSTLDDVLIDAIVASVTGVEGALGLEAVRDLVDETIALNQHRQRSSFHRGFLDILSGEEPDPVCPGASEARRGWYLCGAICGLRRQSGFDAVCSLVDEHRDDLRRLAAGEHDAASLAVPILFEALVHEQRVAEVPELLDAPGVAAAWEEVHRPLLREVTALTRLGQVEEAEPILHLVTRARALHVEAGGRPSQRFLDDLDRRRAHCFRLRRQWREAAGLIEELLARESGDRKAMLLADLGLIRCRLRSLSEVRLPRTEDQLEAQAAALAPGEEAFRESVDCSGPGGHGEFCLAALHLARGSKERALPLLESAVARMGRNPEVYQRGAVLPRARLYLGCCIAATVDPVRAARAIECLHDAVSELPEEAPYLVREALGHLGLAAPQRTTRLLEELRPVLGRRLLDVAVQAGLVRHLSEMRRDLERRAGKTTRSPEERFRDWEALLGSSLAADDESAAMAALDGMEGLSHDEPELSRFLAVLTAPGRIGSLWTPEEVHFARVRLHEARGEYEEAAHLLHTEAHRILRDAGPEGIREAQEFLVIIEEYGLEPDPGLCQRLAALRRGASAGRRVSTEAARSGKVLFLGGHETQQRYDAWLRAHFKDHHPAVRLVLKHPGWGSNWARQLDRLRRDLVSSDAVVLMRFVRTQMGRGVRRLCGDNGIRWYPCTGHGRDSIRGAIEDAIEQLPAAGGGR